MSNADAQRERVWKQRGLLVAPKSQRQGRLAMNSRRFIEGLRCWQQVREMLAAGKRSAEIARFILEEQGERPGVTFNSVKKYVQVYRRFFIPPLEMLRAQMEARAPADRRVIRHKFEGLLGKLQEIEKLEEAMKLQWARIEEQRKTEESLRLPLPGIRLELEALLKLATVLIDKKMELGLPGYRRIPQRVDFRGQLLPAPASRLDLLSPEDRKRLVEFGTTIQQMIEMSRINGTYFASPEAQSSKTR